MKELLTNISEGPKFRRFRRKVIVFRSFMARAWSWINVPGMILILVGVMKPYIQPYFDVSVIWLAIFGLVSLFIIGYLERYLGFFKEDASYGTEQNKLLLKRLDDIEHKIDSVINGRSDNKDTIQNSEH